MFTNKVGAELSGSANNCTMLSRSEFDKESSLDYLLPNESAMIFLKSSKDEFIFTDRALIFIDGDSVTSPKRTIKRTEYYDHPIEHIVFVTAGVMDNDVSISFKLGSIGFHIDIKKSEVENAKLITRCLQNLLIMQDNLKMRYELELKMKVELERMNVHITSGGQYAEILANSEAASERWVNRLMDKYLLVSYKSAFDDILLKLEK